jgi:hypothetical protein
MLDTIIAGDTLTIEYSNSDYSSDSYDIWIALRGLSLSEIDLKTGTTGVTITKAGGGFAVVVTASATASYLAGTYRYAIYMYATGVRYQVETGTVVIEPDIALLDDTDDTRSDTKVALDAIDAVLANRATLDQMSYTIAGRSLSRTPIEDLLVLRDRYAYMYQRELMAERVAAGLNPGGLTKVRF